MARYPSRVTSLPWCGMPVTPVSIVLNKDKHYVTAWYNRDRWSVFWGSYTEAVDVIRMGELQLAPALRNANGTVKVAK